jgi:hypothetical protein
MIENMDAKLMMALQVCRGEQAEGEGNWTEYMKAFGGRLYRPDVAPSEVFDTDEAAKGSPEAPNSPTLKMEITNPLFESLRKK